MMRLNVWISLLIVCCVSLTCVTIFCFEILFIGRNVNFTKTFVKTMKEERQIFSQIEDSKAFLKCRPMFEISKNEDSHSFANSTFEKDEYVQSILNRLLKAKRNKVQSAEDYLGFVKILPTMVNQHQRIFEFKNETRLTQMRGQLPYLPCKVRIYTEADIMNCVNERRKQKESFWIAFIGDSKMRNKFTYFVMMTNSAFKWSLIVHKEARSISYSDYFYNLKKYKDVSVEATSIYGPKLTFLYSNMGFELSSPDVKSYINKWATSGKISDIPDVLVIDFGIWYMLYYQTTDFMDSIDQAFEAWKYAMKFLKVLSKKVPTLVMGQSRGRSMETVFSISRKIYGGTQNNLMIYLSELLHHESLKPQNSDFLDMILMIVLENSDAIFWDSTVPFNLASGKECEVLVRADHPSVFIEAKGRKPFRRLMCYDSIHKTDSTMHDETTMIVNMLCNNFMTYVDSSTCCI